MRKYTKTQLNAIAYDRVRRNQEKARSELLNQYGIDFIEFAWFTGYNGSPCRLSSDIHKRAPITMRMVRMYALFLKEKAEKEVMRERCLPEKN